MGIFSGFAFKTHQAVETHFKLCFFEEFFVEAA